MQAIDGAPLSLMALRTVRLPSEGGADKPAIVRYSVSCANCGADQFRISGFTTPRPTGFLSFLTRQARVVGPPHDLKCLGCAKDARIFDARTDGYDGILNGGSAYVSGEDAKVLLDQRVNVAVTLTYNLNLDELTQLAADAGVQPCDLFDWITIECEPMDGARSFDFSYECA